MKLSQKQQIEFEVLYNSLIGKEIEIIGSSNSNLVGLKGVLIDESANLLFLEQNGSIVKILKNSVTLKISFLGKILKIDGKLLLGTLTTRIKKIK